MKTKIIMGFVGVWLVFGAVGFAQAAVPTLAELQAQLEGLRAQLNAWQIKQAQLTGLQIDSIKPPLNLKAREAGTWMFRASNLPVGQKVDYQTSWGDEPVVSVMQVPTPTNGKIFIHFRHTYAKPGTYTQSFTVSAPGFGPVNQTTLTSVAR